MSVDKTSWFAALGMTSFLLTAFTATAGETLDHVSASKTLVVATNSDYAPQSFMGASNELEGFDVDVAKEIAKRMGAEASFVTPGWEVITAGKWAGRWQMAVGSMTPTKKRAEVLDFPAIYYYTPAGVAVHKDAPYTSQSELNGKHFGVASATVYEDYLKKKLVIDAVGAPRFEFKLTAGEITSYSDVNEIEELALGDGVRVDAVIQGIPAFQQAIKAGKPIKVLGEPLFYEPLAIATDKGDSEFNDRVREIVEQMRADGTLKTFSEKWYGLDYTSVTQ